MHSFSNVYLKKIYLILTSRWRLLYLHTHTHFPCAIEKISHYNSFSNVDNKRRTKKQFKGNSLNFLVIYQQQTHTNTHSSQLNEGFFFVNKILGFNSVKFLVFRFIITRVSEAIFS